MEVFEFAESGLEGVGADLPFHVIAGGGGAGGGWVVGEFGEAVVDSLNEVGEARVPDAAADGESVPAADVVNFFDVQLHVDPFGWQPMGQPIVLAWNWGGLKQLDVRGPVLGSVFRRRVSIGVLVGPK